MEKLVVLGKPLVLGQFVVLGQPLVLEKFLVLERPLAQAPRPRIPPRRVQSRDGRGPSHGDTRQQGARLFPASGRCLPLARRSGLQIHHQHGLRLRLGRSARRVHRHRLPQRHACLKLAAREQLQRSEAQLDFDRRRRLVVPQRQLEFKQQLFVP